MNRTEVLESLQRSDVAPAIVWAYQSACEKAAEDFPRGTGYTALTAGVGRYDLLGDRLDRVFSCGDYEVPEGSESVGLDVLFDGLSERAQTTMPLVPAGLVVRANINNSNGWSYDGFRFVTHSIQIGQLGEIDWTHEKKTKQAIARQDPDAPGPVTLLDMILDETQRAELKAEDALPDIAMPTFVLAHALGRDTDERELFLGLPRYNNDGGWPWRWTENLLDSHHPVAISRRVPGTGPTPPHDTPDVTVRLRKPAAQEKDA